MTKKEKVTPLMQQYHQIKSKYPDALLLFRVGDFYETFYDDAIKTAQTLGITLTHRGSGGDRTELAGFPYHVVNTYLPKLVKAGFRVAVCDQLEDPKATKTIVKRGVTELVTPGVVLNDDILSAKSNNFLASIYRGNKAVFGISFLDISTGEFLTSQGDREYVDKLLQNFSPNEILISKRQKKEMLETFSDSHHWFALEDWVFKEDYAHEVLTQHFQTQSLKGFGIDELFEGILTSGAVLYYLSQTQHHQLQHINTIERIVEDTYVWLDKFTVRNLELYQGTSAQSVTLLDVVDKTLTPMGGRLLKRWLSLPLKSVASIKERHSRVDFWVSNPPKLVQIREELAQMGDMERLISKIATRKITPREIVQLKRTLDRIKPIKTVISASNHPLSRETDMGLFPLEEMCSYIDQALNEEAPINLQKGNVFKVGFSAELDQLRSLSQSGQHYLDQMLERESQQTGIPSLKIGNNNVFGYYFEVRNTHKDKVPDSWIRKQTLVNAERYITDELKTYESKILGAEERIQVLEQELFATLVDKLSSYILQMQQTAATIAQIDVLCGFARLALDRRYCRPTVDESFDIDIKEGRHPVIEERLPVGVPYIANDVFLDRENQQMMMITGPNMSGKSAILRQTALIVLLAQIGSFVPATSARIGVVDKIFTRVGASDNISMGESTFMVEMNEAALILNTVSNRSLVLLDEIGRGTSTYDGISIAWGIAEYLHEHPTRAKTLFATHYHELNEMTQHFPRIKNFNVSIRETKDKVLFLRKLVEGGSEHSFGIHVAKMAGMPSYVIEKANKVLKRLESSHGTSQRSVPAKDTEMQLSFIQLDDPLLEEIKQEILSTDINTLTPIEALMKLNEIKRMLSR